MERLDGHEADWRFSDHDPGMHADKDPAYSSANEDDDDSEDDGVGDDAPGEEEGRGREAGTAGADPQQAVSTTRGAAGQGKARTRKPPFKWNDNKVALLLKTAAVLQVDQQDNGKEKKTVWASVHSRLNATADFAGGCSLKKMKVKFRECYESFVKENAQKQNATGNPCEDYTEVEKCLLTYQQQMTPIEAARASANAKQQAEEAKKLAEGAVLRSAAMRRGRGGGAGEGEEPPPRKKRSSSATSGLSSFAELLATRLPAAGETENLALREREVALKEKEQADCSTFRRDQLELDKVKESNRAEEAKMEATTRAESERAQRDFMGKVMEQQGQMMQALMTFIANK